MILLRVVVGPLATNCYILADGPGQPALVIDPGEDAPTILEALEEQRLGVAALVATHAHPDHVGAMAALQQATGAPFLLHPADNALLATYNGRVPFWQTHPLEPCTPDGELADGQEIAAGSAELRVIHTPGHTPGSVCLLGDGFLFSGDTLFQGSIGRTDFPGGDQSAILASIRERLYVLPRVTTVLPGHGDPTTIQQERTSNPFVRA